MSSPITAADYIGPVPATSITVVDDGDKVKADDLRVPIAALLANDDYIINDVTDGLAAKANRSGDTFTGLVTFDAGATVTSGQTVTVDGVTITGAKTITGNTVFSGSSNTTMSAGRKTFNRGRVTLSDASQSVNVGSGDRFSLPTNPAAPRTITLTNTSTVPLGGETMIFFWNPGGAGGGGTQYTFQREDATVVATFVGAQVADTGAVFAEFEYVFGVGWRLGKHSGTPNEYVPPTPGPESWDSYGVIPGAGA